MSLRIPPVLQFLACTALGWALAALLDGLTLSLPGTTPLGWAMIVIGGMLLIVSVSAFISARTTVNPLAPAKAEKLVTTGLYRLSRNPMYLALAIVLVGEAVLLANLAAFAAPAIFVVAITTFQILPEERALRENFGNEYLTYCHKTRRWI